MLLLKRNWKKNLKKIFHMTWRTYGWNICISEGLTLYKWVQVVGNQIIWMCVALQCLLLGMFNVVRVVFSLTVEVNFKNEELLKREFYFSSYDGELNFFSRFEFYYNCHISCKKVHEIKWKICFPSKTNSTYLNIFAFNSEQKIKANWIIIVGMLCIIVTAEMPNMTEKCHQKSGTEITFHWKAKPTFTWEYMTNENFHLTIREVPFELYSADIQNYKLMWHRQRVRIYSWKL